MFVLSGIIGTFVLGVSSAGTYGVGSIAGPVAATAFAVPLGGTMPLTIIAASI